MDEALSDTELNTCATSYVTADNSRSMGYCIWKVICKWKDKNWSIQKYLFMYKVLLFQYKSQFNKGSFYDWKKLFHTKERTKIEGVNE
jgi:hypothetical protein